MALIFYTMITNNSNIPLSVAVGLVDDDYDYVNDPKYISATSLLRPLKQIILTKRVNTSIAVDLEDMVARFMGTSLHASLEKAWKEHYKKNLKFLGYNDAFIDRVKINPTIEELTPNTFPIYIEQRASKELDGYTIGGKYDLIIDGQLNDYKSTSVYTWIHGDKDDDYRLQGSIYRWLNPDKITEDYIRINFIFTDWQKNYALSDPNYPKSRIQYKDISLLSLEETERYIKNKIQQIEKYKNASEIQIPECTDEDLWRTKGKYKYYANATKTSGRSTKNFDDASTANKYWKIHQQGKGIVIYAPGEVKRCQYCPASPVCKQRLRYI